MTDVTVTQADRDAAANGVLRRLAYQCGGIQSWMDPAVASMRRGEQDDHPDIEDFARHRQAALADAQGEAVAWKNYAEDGDWWLTDEQEPPDSCERSVLLYTHPPAQDVEALVEAAWQAERAAVVAFLRGLTEGVELPAGCTTGEVWILTRCAAIIEAGEHLL